MAEAFDGSPVAVQEAPPEIEEAPQEAAAAQGAKDGEVAIDVDLGFDMEWEVITEPAPKQYYGGQYQQQPQYQPRYQQQQYRPQYQPQQYRPQYQGRYQSGQYSQMGYDRYGRQVTVARRWNKHIFTWMFSFVLGLYGIDRFCRGQIGLGLLKLFTFGGFGVWYLTDVIIAVIKSYYGEYAHSEELLFDNYGNYIY